MLKDCSTCPERSMYSVQFIFWAWINVFQTSSSSSELTETSRNPLLKYLFWRFCKIGTDSRQGGHQVPQKSINTTLPRSVAFETAWPSAEVNEKSGAKGSRARIGLAIIFRASAEVSAFAPGE